MGYACHGLRRVGIMSTFQPDKIMFPELLYGDYATVLKSCHRKATVLARVRVFRDIFGEDFIDVVHTPGQIILARAWSMISATIPQFHVDLFWKAVAKKESLSDNQSLDSIVDSMLETPWGFLSVLSHSYEVVRHSNAQLAFITFARRHWR
jgi:hypothetical protein